MKWNRVIAALLAAALLSVAIGCGALAEDGGAQGSPFADEALERAVCGAAGVPDGPLTAEALARVEQLEVDDDMQYDLTGIEALCNLRELVLREQMTGILSGDLSMDLSPLSALTGLERLSLNLWEIKDLTPLAGLINLRYLNLTKPDNDVAGHGVIKDLSPLSGLTRLEELVLEGNDMPSLHGLEGLTLLRRLSLYNCDIRDLSALSSLTWLEELDMGDAVCDANEYGPVSDLSALAGLSGLRVLSLESQNIDDLSALSGLAALESLNVSGTRVVDLSPLSGLASLEALDLSYTDVADLTPLSGLTSLRELDLYGTAVEDTTPVDGIAGLHIAR